LRSAAEPAPQKKESGRNRFVITVKHCAAALIAGLVSFAHCAPAHADPNDYVLDLDYTYGEREFDAKLGAASSTPAGAPAAEAGAISWGTALTNAWFSEVYLQMANSTAGSSGGGIDSYSWENILRFAEPGEWPVGLGAFLEVERPRVSSQGWKFTFGPMAQADVNQFQFNANVLFTRIVQGQIAEPTQIGYQFQVKYRAAEHFEYGAQAMGDVGTWDRWSQGGPPTHRLGPAVFGRFKLGPGRAFRYNAAVLVGTTSHAPDRTVRAQLEYEY
jgi:hypothetical protein